MLLYSQTAPFFVTGFFLFSLSSVLQYLPENTNYSHLSASSHPPPLVIFVHAQSTHILRQFSFLLACGIKAMNAYHDWLPQKATSRVKVPAEGKVLL